MLQPYLSSRSYLNYTLLVIALLLSSWHNVPNHFLSRNKAGAGAFRLSTTIHQITLKGVALKYNATTGYMPINGGRATSSSANIFYTAYTLTDNKRPVTFVFNGGPGSASIWLHMGSFGPVRVLFKNEKGDAPVKAGYGDDPYSWLAFTDLVFIDPVSTGYSRSEDGVDPKAFYNYQSDIAAIGSFINNYLTQSHREGSPKFLAGESYGSIRAIGLAEHLQDAYHISLNGITLISPALNYQLINFHHGNETPYSYYLPSYAIAAQYHQRLAPQLQRLSIEQLKARVTNFAQGTYARFLNEGDAADQALTNQVIDSLNYYTGLSKDVLRSVNGRVSDTRFAKALLQDDKQFTGTFDSRFTTTAQNADPSEINLRGLFTSAFDQYIRQDLRYQNNLPYQATTAMSDWDYGPDANNSYLDISATLKKVMTNNPYLKIQVATGYYDLATPVGSTEYVIRHLGLNAALRDNISLNYYRSGHMVYISRSADEKFKNDSEKFYQNTLIN